MIQIVDCPAEEEAESEAEAVATTETLNNDTDEVVEYIINKLCHDSTKLKLQIEVRDSPSRLPKEMSGLLSSPYMCLPQSKRAYGGHNATFIYNKKNYLCA